MHQELLEKARAAGADLAEAERRVLTTRADYHTAIRRLHLAGAPLREIADALSLSHQRVQQIVTGSGGSWWRRAWRTRRSTADAVCTWCDRPPSEVAKLVAGPNVYICDACVTAAGRVERGQGKSGGPLKMAKAASRERCTFCHKRPSDTRAVVTGPAANICSDCLRTCREIMEISAA
jgi:ClpX C4-type zinc finger protein